MIKFLIPLAIVVLLAMPLIPVFRGVTTGKKAKRAVIYNLCAFFGVIALSIFFPVSGIVSAETTGAAAGSAQVWDILLLLWLPDCLLWVPVLLLLLPPLLLSALFPKIRKHSVKH